VKPDFADDYNIGRADLGYLAGSGSEESWFAQSLGDSSVISTHDLNTRLGFDGENRHNFWDSEFSQGGLDTVLDRSWEGLTKIKDLCVLSSSPSGAPAVAFLIDAASSTQAWQAQKFGASFIRTFKL